MAKEQDRIKPQEEKEDAGFKRKDYSTTLQLGNITPTGRKAEKMTMKEIKEAAIKKIWGEKTPKAEKEEAQKKTDSLLDKVLNRKKKDK